MEVTEASFLEFIKKGLAIREGINTFRQIGVGCIVFGDQSANHGQNHIEIDVVNLLDRKSLRL